MSLRCTQKKQRMSRHTNPQMNQVTTQQIAHGFEHQPRASNQQVDITVTTTFYLQDIGLPTATQA